MLPIVSRSYHSTCGLRQTNMFIQYSARPRPKAGPGPTLARVFACSVNERLLLARLSEFAPWLRYGVPGATMVYCMFC